MDATTPRDLDQLDAEALKALILALREQVFSHRKQLTTQQEEILSQREQLASRDAENEHLKLLIAKGSFHPGGVGRRIQPAACAAGGGVATSRDGCGETTRG